VLQLGHVFCRGRFLRETPRQHELGFEHRPGRHDPAVERGSHPAVDGVEHLPLHLGDDLSGVLLVPVPVQMLGHAAELDQEVAGQVLRLGLAALLPPQPEQCRLVVPHDDPGIRATDESTAVPFFPAVGFHVFLSLLENRSSYANSTGMIGDDAYAMKNSISYEKCQHEC
jgi:hypothetical protein